MKWPYSPVVEIFPHVLGQNHHQVINVVVLIGRDPCGGKARGRVNQGAYYCWVKTQIKKGRSSLLKTPRLHHLLPLLMEDSQEFINCGGFSIHGLNF